MRRFFAAILVMLGVLFILIGCGLVGLGVLTYGQGAADWHVGWTIAYLLVGFGCIKLRELILPKASV